MLPTYATPQSLPIMFFEKFFSKQRDKKRRREEAIAHFAVADVPVEKLLERFHSDSALCTDTNQRRILQEAVGVTEQHITLRNVAINSRQMGAETCVQIARLHDDAGEVRRSQDVIRSQAGLASATFAAHHAVVDGLRDHQVADAEQKLESLSTMAEHVTTATQVLGQNMRALSRPRGHRSCSRNSFSRVRAGADQAVGVQASIEHYQGVVSGMEVQLQRLKASEHRDKAAMEGYDESLAAMETLIAAMEGRIEVLQDFVAAT